MGLKTKCWRWMARKTKIIREWKRMINQTQTRRSLYLANKEEVVNLSKKSFQVQEPAITAKAMLNTENEALYKYYI